MDSWDRSLFLCSIPAPKKWSCGPAMVKPEPSRECQRAVPDADMQLIFHGVPMDLMFVGRTPGPRLTPRSASVGSPMKMKPNRPLPVFQRELRHRSLLA